MSPPALLPRFSPELRASVFHFTVYTTNGVAAAYFGIWLRDREILPDQIGIINAAPVLVLLIMNLFVGRIADKASDWRQAIIGMALIAGAIPLGLFFTNGFWGILTVWSLFSVFAGSIGPVIDAATLRLTQRNGTNFGEIRAWGTIGSMVGTAVAGLLVTWLGPIAFLPVLLGFSLLRALASLQLPRFRAPERAATLNDGESRAGRLGEVLKPWFVLPLVAFALVQATHWILQAFAALIWQDQGLSSLLIGLLVATGTASEAAMMFAWRRLGRRVSARQMILASAVAAAARWTVMAFAPPVPVLFLLQMLHSITFAIGYLGMVHFIANWTREEIAAEAQGFSFVLQQGVSVVALVVFGRLVGLFGTRAFLAAAVLALVAAGCVWLSLRLRPARDGGTTARAG